MFEKFVRRVIASGGNSVLDQLEAELPFAGVATFMKRPYGRDVRGADVVVMGIPFDGGTSYRPGTRFGPRAIREQSVYAAELQPVYPWQKPILEGCSVIDFGDIASPPGSGEVETMIELSEAAAAEVFKSGAALLTLGGDHTVAYGPIRAAAARFGKLALIHLDSHQDSYANDSFAPGLRLINHATFAADLVNEGKIAPELSTQAYIRTRMPEVVKGGYRIINADEAARLGPEQLAEEVRKRVAGRPTYLSLDIDALDPAFAPGTGTPVPGGPSTAELRRFLKALSGVNIVAADIVEVNPLFDPTQTTAIAAAYLAADLIYLLSAARG